MASQTLRLKLQAAAGAACFGLFLYAGWVKRWEPFHTYFYLFAWASFLWVIDRTLASRAGISPLSRPRSLARLLCLSTTFWLIFEVFNFRLSNWVYLNVPTERWLRWPGYALSFATVMPGILMVRKLVDSYLPRNSLPPGGGGRGWGGASPPSRPSPTKGEGVFLTLGLLMILLPLLWPRYFFPFIWGGVFLLLDPWVAKKKGHSLWMDWKNGELRHTWTLLAAGLACGLFWEGCNFGAGAKWRYTLPYWEFSKIFEMPVLGFIGFMPFALEAHAFHQAASLFWRGRSAFQRVLIALGTALFWGLAFTGIDRWTVIEWR